MKRLKLLHFIFLIIWAQAFDANAQKNELPGYIINNSKDTILGTIINKEWEITPTSLKFKADSEIGFKEYKPENLLGFGVDQRYLYISRKVLLDVSPIRIEELNYSKYPNTVTRHIFLKILASGKVRLYLNKDENYKEHFFISKDGGFEELIFRKFLTPERQIVDVERFKNQLSFYLADCPSVIAQIKRLSYNESDLKEIIALYNKCVDPEAHAYIFEAERKTLAWEIFAGLSSTVISFEGSASVFKIKSVKFQPSTNFTFGTCINFPLQKKFKRHYLSGEFMWKKMSFDASRDSTYAFSSSLIKKFHLVYDMEFTYLKFNILYKYNLIVKPSTAAFIEAGISNGIAIKTKDIYSEVSTLPNVTTKIEYSIFHGPRKHEESLMFGIGAMFRKKYGLKLLYELGNGMSKYAGLSSDVQTYYLLASFRF